MRLAATWLANNEGEDDERCPCMRVADWLEREANEDELRKAAREGGVPVGRLRAKLKATPRTIAGEGEGR